MSKVETVTFVQMENAAQDPQTPENFTSINGIYGNVVEPLFLNAKNNVTYSPVELARAEQSYFERESLRFFQAV
ncbi:MAG TPA: hypothetical protein VJN93_13170 [Candidatus Acidoferrum sp.]|nr:hypothetical protein [Candidatus Acidoferrum sp.]